MPTEHLRLCNWDNRLTKSVPLSEPFLIEKPIFIPKKDEL